jgi:hypothetical protein
VPRAGALAVFLVILETPAPYSERDVRALRTDGGQLRPVDQALDLETRIAEIKQKADLKAGRHQIVQALGTMDRIQRLDGFQFHENEVFHQQISRVRANDHAIILDGNATNTPT